MRTNTCINHTTHLHDRVKCLQVQDREARDEEEARDHPGDEHGAGDERLCVCMQTCVKGSKGRKRKLPFYARVLVEDRPPIHHSRTGTGTTRT